MPDEAIGCGFHEAVRGVLSHHVVIRDGKIANYHPYPPTPWNANPRDIYGTPGPYEDAVQNTPIFEENGPDKFKGIDIMRTVRSFDPCLPCGVHMYLGNGKVIETRHSPMFGFNREIEVNTCPKPRTSRNESLASKVWFTSSRRAPTPACRAAATELVQSLMDLHGAGLERLLEIVAETAGDKRRRSDRSIWARPPGEQPAGALWDSP